MMITFKLMRQNQRWYTYSAYHKAV